MLKKLWIPYLLFMNSICVIFIWILCIHFHWLWYEFLFITFTFSAFLGFCPIPISRIMENNNGNIILFTKISEKSKKYIKDSIIIGGSVDIDEG